MLLCVFLSYSLWLEKTKTSPEKKIIFYLAKCVFLLCVFVTECEIIYCFLYVHLYYECYTHLGEFA